MIFQIVLIVILVLGWLWLIHTCNFMYDKIKFLERKLADHSHPAPDFDEYWYATSTVHKEDIDSV